MAVSEEVRIKLEVDVGHDELLYQGQGQHNERFEINTKIEDGEEEEIEWPPALSTIKQEVEEVAFKLYYYNDSQDVDNSSESDHPRKIPTKKVSTDDMVLNAVQSLNARRGSTLQDIKKAISHTYNVEEDTIRMAIIKLVKGGKLTQINGTGANGAFKIPVPDARPTKMSVNRNLGVQVQGPSLETESFPTKALGRTRSATFGAAATKPKKVKKAGTHKKARKVARKEAKPKPLITYFCHYCKYERDYASFSGMWTHFTMDHNLILESIPCQDCNVVSVSKLMHRFHRLRHTNFWRELSNFSLKAQLEKEICFSKRISINCPLPSCTFLAPFKRLQDFESHVSTVHGGFGFQNCQEAPVSGVEIKQEVFATEIKEEASGPEIKEEEDIEFLGVVGKDCDGGIFPDL